MFGYAPYWTLPQSSGFDVKDLTTLAYFSVDANADGTLDESGPGWNGYQSQDLVDLVTRAHAAGDRVVLTVTCFEPADAGPDHVRPEGAGRAWRRRSIAAVEAKNLDGVDFDFEGEGSGDRVGLTNLITTVSAALHATDPHWQVTMATYASAAGDPGGFTDIAALAPAVDAFFVMAYDMNSRTQPSATSPLFGPAFTDAMALEQYLKVVPASKVILGLPYYGYDWPTVDGTPTSAATGPESPLSDADHRRRRPSDLLGPGDRYPVDGLPGGHPVAPHLLRRPDLARPQGAAGQLLPHRRGGDLGPRHGREQPRHAGGAAGQRTGGQGRPDRTTAAGYRDS